MSDEQLAFEEQLAHDAYEGMEHGGIRRAAVPGRGQLPRPRPTRRRRREFCTNCGGTEPNGHEAWCAYQPRRNR